jgi:hypothetical protein
MPSVQCPDYTRRCQDAQCGVSSLAPDFADLPVHSMQRGVQLVARVQFRVRFTSFSSLGCFPRFPEFWFRASVMS